MFADQTVLSGVLWPLEDRTGAARDVISTAGVVLDHRKIDSFGKITSQTGPTVDYDQFFSGLSWDSDSQLYYARARWYDPVGGKFIGEDPLRFGAGDANLTRYSANDPVNFSDPTGLSIGSFFSNSRSLTLDAFYSSQFNGELLEVLQVCDVVRCRAVDRAIRRCGNGANWRWLARCARTVYATRSQRRDERRFWKYQRGQASLIASLPSCGYGHTKRCQEPKTSFSL